MTTTQPQTHHSTSVPADRDGGLTTPVVGFLGIGRMGGPMAANLARAGFDVRVWNRTRSHAEALAADGAVVMASPAEAIRGATVVITMLTDGSATEQAVTGPDGFLTAGPETIWVQMGTIGVAWTARLGHVAAARGVLFVDAPVSGSEGPAKAGQLVILASGPGQVRDILAPVFAVLGRDTVWLGPAGHGTAAKLVLNNWLADLTETTAETLSFARRLGLDPAEIVDLLESNPLGAPYAVQKATTRDARFMAHALVTTDLREPPRDQQAPRPKVGVTPSRDHGVNRSFHPCVIQRKRRHVQA